MGKSQFTSYTFIYKPLLFCYFANSDIKLKVLYFPLEETPERIMQRFISWLLFDFSRGRIRVSPRDLRSTKSAVSQEVLDIAKINNINVHASLLPKLRGGAPIHRSIINGDKTTGVTIMKMVYKMDAGCMYAKQEVEIDEQINTTELFNKLQYVGRDLLLKVLPDLLDNKLEGIEQNEDEATYSFNIKREEEKIDFNKTTLQVHNLVRGLAEVPGAYCIFKEKEMKVYKAKIYKLCEDNVEVGSLKIENKNELIVKCSDGYLRLLEIKLEGKQRMDVSAFLNGCNKQELVKEKLS